MADIDLSKLTPEEREKLFQLLEKAERNAPASPEPPKVQDISRLTEEPHVDFSNREWGQPPAPNPGSPAISRVKEPTEWVRKQIDNIKAVGRTNYLAGIRAPKKSPIQAAIAAQDRYEEQMRKDEVLKRRKEGLEKVTDDEWLAMAESIGADRLVDGVVKRQHKVERFVSKFQPLLKDHLAKIDAMPNVTDADRENRMLENLRGLKKLKGKWK